MTEPTTSGPDLARQALTAYRATSKTKPSSVPKPRTRRSVRGERREPAGLGNVLGNLTTELGWQTGVQGGGLLDRWPELCPQYVGRVEPAHFDPRAGRLDLRPASPAYATQLRLLGGQLCKQINDKLGESIVRSIRVLPVGAVATVPPSAPTPAAPAVVAASGPAKTRETASAGYRATLAAIRRPEPRTPSAAVLKAQQAQARDAAREPETAFAQTVAAMEDLAPAAIDSAETIRKAAIARKYNGGRDLKTVFGAG